MGLAEVRRILLVTENSICQRLQVDFSVVSHGSMLDTEMILL